MECKHIFKFDETLPVSKKQDLGHRLIRAGLICLTIALILGSYILRDNLLYNLHWLVKILLISVVAIPIFMLNKKEDIPSPVEIRFYDDLLMFYMPKRYGRRRVCFAEYIVMKYDEISKCEYKTVTGRLIFSGCIRIRRYGYTENGTMSNEPGLDGMVKNTKIYFHTGPTEDINFKAEIERHSPIRVDIGKF